MTQTGGSSASKATLKDLEGPQSQLAQALQELARGEQTAAALENNLTNLESKIDELLASFEHLTEQATTDEKDPADEEAGKDQTGHSSHVEEKSSS